MSVQSSFLFHSSDATAFWIKLLRTCWITQLRRQKVWKTHLACLSLNGYLEEERSAHVFLPIQSWWWDDFSSKWPPLIMWHGAQSQPVPAWPKCQGTWSRPVPASPKCPGVCFNQMYIRITLLMVYSLSSVECVHRHLHGLASQLIDQDVFQYYILWLQVNRHISHVYACEHLDIRVLCTSSTCRSHNNGLGYMCIGENNLTSICTYYGLDKTVSDSLGK